MQKEVVMKLAGIEYVETNKRFSNFGGLPFYHLLIDREITCRKGLTACLPKYKKVFNTTSFEKFKTLLLGMIVGKEAISDISNLRYDPVFQKLNSHVNAPNVLGKYLKRFQKNNIESLHELLIATSLNFRAKALPKNKRFVLDIDSTDHKQYGTQMEGLAYNYRNVFGLSSLHAYDELGFPYWFEARPGNTHTSINAQTVIHQVFKKVKQAYAKELKYRGKKRMKLYLRMDSGYSSVALYNAAYGEGVKFVTPFRKSGNYEKVLKTVTHWYPAKKIHCKGGIEPEIGSTIYYPADAHEALRVVFIRGIRQEQGVLFENPYVYHAFITNIDSSDMNNEQLIKFYRGRGIAETFIRELKNGFDFQNFPCRELSANYTFGLIGMLAMSLMRFVSYLMNPNRPQICKSNSFLFNHDPLSAMVSLP